MIRHLLKLAWNRKRSNALLVLEIAVSFLVVFAVASVGLQFARNARRPLGFEVRDVCVVSVRPPDRGEGNLETTSNPAVLGGADGLASSGEVLSRLLREARTVDGVVGVAGATVVPYGGGTDAGTWDHDGGAVNLEFSTVTDELKDVLGLTVTRGRWFEPSDAALSWRPLVVDEEMAEAWFGEGVDPVGKDLPLLENGPETRIVGVVKDFRKRGELSPAGNFLFTRARLDDEGSRTPENLVIRLRPGLDATFERDLVKRLQPVAPGYVLQASRLDQMRESSLRSMLAPLAGAGVVALFLLLMASLGLLGVLWQNVTRRTREIGLRRAIGASRREICKQMLLEVFLTASVGVLLGSVVVLQVPLLDVIGFFEGRVVASALLASAAVIYAVALACGVYPGLLAARVRPAEALHQE